MKDLVEVIAKALVEHPDDVVVEERQEGRIIKVDLLVNPSDMGKVIGRQGRIAKAIRSVVKAAATRDDVMVDVNIDALDTGSSMDTDVPKDTEVPMDTERSKDEEAAMDAGEPMEAEASVDTKAPSEDAASGEG